MDDARQLLLVEPGPALRQLLREHPLPGASLRTVSVVEALGAPDALGLLVDASGSPDLVAGLRRASSRAPVVALAIGPSAAGLDRWLEAGVQDFVVLPGAVTFAALLRRLHLDAERRDQQDADEARRQRESVALLSLASRAGTERTLAQRLAAITEAGGHATHAARVSVWLTEVGGIRCADLYEEAAGTHGDGGVLLERDHPAYFAGLREGLVAVDDVQDDPRTRSLIRDHLQPHGIGAMLDCAVVVGGVLRAVFCLAHVGPPRRWTSSETLLARGLAEAVGSALESSARAAAEARAKESEYRFGQIFIHSTEAMSVVARDAQGQLIFEDLNDACAAQLATTREALLGRRIREVAGEAMGARAEQRWAAVAAARTTIFAEDESELPRGRVVFNLSVIPFFDADGSLRRIGMLGRDVTQQRRLEEAAHRNQTLEALGRLAGHVAHDFNNILTGIAGWATTLERSSEPRSREASEHILQATERGRQLTRQVLTFGQKTPRFREPQELSSLAREVLRLLEPGWPAAVKCVSALEPARVDADGGQLHQVVMNLCKNALQAMPSGGVLTVGTRVETLGEAQASALRLEPGRWAHLWVEDTGHGMDEATRAHIFEPFFTTRPRSNGTGLGLPVVHGVVHSHGGAVSVRSAPGQGATFDLYFPVSATVAEAPKAATPARRRVLLVEDQQNLARVSALVLEQLGFTTAVCFSGEEALERLQRPGEDFDLVLTDWQMPTMSGRDFTLAVHRLRPALPVVVTTGGVLPLAELEAAQVSAVLGKPWRPDEARKVLTEALRAAQPTS
ncbi:MAG: response regulator [Myxococcaceae bacterium]|nr:response regulator [Myxococcaceae bacterium]